MRSEFSIDLLLFLKVHRLGELEHMRCSLRFDCVYPVFAETLYTIGDNLYAKTTKCTKSLHEERPHDSAYAEAERFNILGNILRGSIAGNVKKRLFKTCIEILEDALATFGDFDETVASPYVQHSGFRNPPRPGRKCARALSLVREPASFDENQGIYIAGPKTKNRDLELGKIRKL